jgi:hypothetical protein
MRTRAHDLSLDTSSRRAARTVPRARRMRMLPNRVHLRRGYRLRGHIQR